MNYDRLVVAYHGCAADVAERLLAGEPFKPSENQYDWLGKGVYFWEYGLDRAWQWAKSNKKSAPAVIGAVIQLGRCFDLLDTRATDTLASFAKVYIKGLRKAGKPIPRNSGADRKARFLDCAIINWTLEQVAPERTYQSVRCAFSEGRPVYSSGKVKSAIVSQSHVQIAVRDPMCIIGVFRPTSG